MIIKKKYDLPIRRFALVWGALIAFSRAAGYTPGIRRSPVQDPILALTLDREWLLYAYVTAWTLAGVSCLLAIKSGRLIPPFGLVSALMVGWGVAWFAGWTQKPETDWWLTAITYAGPAFVILAVVTLIPRKPPNHDPHPPQYVEDYSPKPGEVKSWEGQ